MNGLNLTGVVLIAFVAVSCADFLAQDMDASDRADSWNESTDAEGSQKNGAEISKTTVSSALEADALQDWTCPEDYYGTDDGCDCGCGVIDPDCFGDSTRYACEYFFCESEVNVYLSLNHLCEDQEVKIMPVGDSITAGEHYGYPAVGLRTGYRYALFWYLNRVHFVGSQNHGYVRDFDYHSEAYPGQRIPYIADRLEDALPIYRPDILLVHVGTNPPHGWDKKPGQVMDMLDMINNTPGKKPTWVLLCEIINRFQGGHQDTTDFNDAVRYHAEDRLGDEYKIIVVDMEKGAGFNYSDEPPNGDMWGRTYPGVSYDKYHPNDLGNQKMAEKFYDVLTSSPVLLR
jgi:lysophospholipase L1-like esterase